MKLIALSLLVLAGAALAQDAPPPDPEGTVVVDLEVGGTVDALAPPGAHVVCDDPEIIGPEMASDGGSSFVLRALKPGSTLCGVRQAGEIPGGLYRVRVKAKPEEKKAEEKKAEEKKAEEKKKSPPGKKPKATKLPADEPVREPSY